MTGMPDIIDLPYPSLYRWQVFQHVFSPQFRNVPTLDLGCNNGAFLVRIVGCPKIGLDLTILPEVKNLGLTLTCADATRVPFKDNYFQQIIVFDLIEHVGDDREVLREASRVLAPGGVMWISTPAHDFRLFPRRLTARAARGWGHVRNGYTAEELIDKLPCSVEVNVTYWNEPLLRFAYIGLRASNSCAPRLARWGARQCFRFDRHWPEGKRGHLLAKVMKPA